MGSVYDTLLERGYIKQMTHEEPLINLLKNEKVTFYIGFDPTADSLHVGHFLQLMVMAYMQKAGHRPIALIGGGTAMVGDPSGKTDMRKMMTPETIRHNSECFKKQLSRFIDFSEERAIMVDNGEWLLQLNYIDFLREIGIYFSVNRMLTAESYKNRLERGLTFLEFNYQLMQAYDFLELYRKYNCVVQLGGDDQWSNILAGTDLIRRKAGVEAYGLTFTLLTTSEGKKMGKTETGALWLDAEKTSPYEFYQYWRNINDPDVENCLALLTFLPMEEVRRLGGLPGEQINEAKKVLAYEVTKLIHGEDEAVKARSAAESLFGAGDNFENVPTTALNGEQVSGGIGILEVMILAGLISSKGEGRRLITQGGVSVNGNKVEDIFLTLTKKDFIDGKMMIRKGKKVYHQFIVN
ncbi:tyrosine--tRNA ligase [Pelotomaculum terephthalicicum JT]|uniref:tyrosine--tRNA ligase n=1 Tax=Pelotomaculum TaxID=191373 RepID=UPI0009CDFE0E|nr:MULTISPECIES: tyrosine--tRNA ligase [Pelotomaculum]MCG9968875.1 tyrosine--tRNA ligase [Pelotomaculum terephthalicicum JT]OPX87440.1 MAG: Tyrosine--tRNA ligase [Pelotomaculum sp. PtaB.Bin117]OPY61595.1 MAG: Tyrosine--tRNA ligase [Pelotomaculum sp. PtaU1.Bin065]